jgi:hypothetical protein
VQVLAAPAEGRSERARRRSADRWIEELLYDHALRAGLFDTPAPFTLF